MMRFPRLGQWFQTTAISVAATAYLLYDDFATDRAAGAVHTNAASPGPGGGAGTDTESKMSVSGGKLLIASGKASPAWGDPARRYDAIARAVGRVLLFSVKTTVSAKDFMFGFDTNSTTTADAALFVSSNAIRWWETSGINVSLDTAVLDVVYDCAIFMRAAGYQLYIRGGKFADWSLLWTSATHSGASLIPSIISNSATLEIEYIKLPATYKMFAPVASDGFASWGSTNGLGHAEGVAATYGAGGSGLAWTDRVGTWGASGGSAAASALTGGVAMATIDTSLADYVVTVKLTRSAGNCGVVIRYLDANNYAYVWHNGTQVSMRKVVAGTDSQVTSPLSATYVAGAELTISVFANTQSIFWNNALIATGVTNDNALQIGRHVGLYTTDTGNTFDDFVVRGRGHNDEYDWLNQLAPTRAKGLFAMGDSKTEDDAWVGNLVTLLGSEWAEVTPRFGFGSYTAASMLVYMASNFAAVSGYAHTVVINFGANEFAAMPTEATWLDTMQSIIRQVRAKWHGVKIYVAKPWRRHYATEANTLAGWVDTLVALYPAGVYVGPDERTWLENGDDGATYTYDGIHYNDTAQPVAAAQWIEAIN